MAAQRYVLVSPIKATREDRLENNRRMQMWHQERILISQACVALGHRELTRKILPLAKRIKSATSRSDTGRVPSDAVTKMLERADDGLQARSKRTRCRYVNVLKRAGLIETGHGWVRWLGVGNHLSLVSKNAQGGTNGADKNRPKGKPGRPKRMFDKNGVLLGFAKGGASAAGAIDSSSRKFFKDTNTSAHRAAAVHAKRNSAGQFLPKSPTQAPEARIKPVQTDLTSLSQCHDRSSVACALQQESEPEHAEPVAQATEAADAGVGFLKKMPKESEAQRMVEAFLALGAAHPESENERLAAEEQRLAQLAEWQRHAQKQPVGLTVAAVREVNAHYGLKLNIFKLKRAGITDNVLNDAARFTFCKHLDEPFDSLEGAIMNSAMQRKRGFWGPKR